MLTWETVETIASTRGYPRKTIRMWRERGVSHKARIDLFKAAEATDLKFDIADFDALPIEKPTKAKAA